MVLVVVLLPHGADLCLHLVEERLGEGEAGSQPSGVALESRHNTTHQSRMLQDAAMIRQRTPSPNCRLSARLPLPLLSFPPLPSSVPVSRPASPQGPPPVLRARPPVPCAAPCGPPLCAPPAACHPLAGAGPGPREGRGDLGVSRKNGVQMHAVLKGLIPPLPAPWPASSC